MVTPEVRYARNSGVSIAYQVFGEGPRDLLFVCGTMSHLELWWADPAAADMLQRLARSSRVILFDKPGTGLSDPLPAAPTIEQRTADLLAVLDAVGAERAVVLGYSEGGLPAIALAATQPGRVEALILLDTLVAMDPKPDIDLPESEWRRTWGIIDAACEAWGSGGFAAALAPTWAENPALRPLLATIERQCMSPGMARSVLQGYHGMDVRDAAAAVRVPTLVAHCEEDDLIPAALGHDLARRIRGATFVPLRGADHFVWIHNSESLPDAIEGFLTGQPHPPHDADRFLTTIVFTDIADSTRQIAELGDARWRSLLAHHDRRLDELLGWYGGAPIKHTGDGRLVHFTRPARAVRFAAAMAEAAGGLGLGLRAGVHVGECERVGDDVIGLAVNIAARVVAVGRPGDVVVTATARDTVMGSGLAFDPLGEHELRGVPGRWGVFRYLGDRPGPLLDMGYETDVRNPVPSEDGGGVADPTPRLSAG